MEEDKAVLVCEVFLFPHMALLAVVSTVPISELKIIYILLIIFLTNPPI